MQRIRRPRQGLGHTLLFIFLIILLCSIIAFGCYVTGSHVWAHYHYRQAERALQQREFDQARYHLARCLKVWSGSAEMHFLAARTARRAGAYDAAEMYLRKAQQLQAVPEFIELERALLRAQRDDLDRVEQYLLRCVQQNHPDIVYVLEVLTPLYLKMFSLPQAQRLVNLWLEREPDNVQALYWRAEITMRMGTKEEALADFQRVVELAPQRDDARLKVAEFLLLVNRPEEARAQYEYLRHKQPENPAVLLGLARSLAGTGRSAEARPLLEQILTAHPEHVEALGERARLAREEGRMEEAEKDLRKAATLAPHNKEILYDAYTCLEQRGKLDEAKEYGARLQRVVEDIERLKELTQKIAESPRDASLRYEAGLVFLRNDQENDGLRWLLSALREEPTHRPTHQALADYYERTGQAERAAYHRRLALGGP